MGFRVLAGWASIAGLALVIAGCGAAAVNPNLPAIVTQPVDETTSVGSTATFTVTASGQAPLFYQWYVFATAIKGATSASYTTPITAPSDNGSFYFVVVSNSLGSIESGEVTMTVNTPPVFTSAIKSTLLVGQAGSFIVTASGTPTPTFSETGTLPTGITFVDNMNGSATIAGTPTAAGIFPLTFTSQNGITPNATQKFTLTTATQAPTITNANNIAFTEDQPGSFTVTATGAPIPALTETGALPAGVTFLDNKNSTATLSGTPTVSGTFPFTISAQNGINPNASQPFTLTVTSNAAPALVPVRPENFTTFHDDAARSGQNLNETILTPANVTAATFGKTGLLSVDGPVDAQPLYLSNVSIAGQGTYNVLYVATENDSVYAFDAASGAILWRDGLAAQGETAADITGCAQGASQLGISSTPVIDRAHGPNGTIYVIAVSEDSSGNYYQRVHALDAATGSELSGGPAAINGLHSPANANPSATNPVFDPSQVQAQGGLLLLNGQVYASFAPLCNSTSGKGWVMAFNETSLNTTSALSFAPDGAEVSVSLSGAGLSADATGNLYLFDGQTTRTGTWNVRATSNQASLSNAFLKLSTSTEIEVAGYSNLSSALFASTSEGGPDLAGALVLPDLADASGKIWHLAVGAGTDANIYVVNRDALNGASLQSTAIYQEVSGVLSPNGVQSLPSYFGNTVYYGAGDDAIKAFGITDARLSSSPVSQTTNIFGLTGASPAISANLTTGAILWAVDNTGNGSLLHAYDASNLSQEFYNSSQASNGRDSLGNAPSFATPVIANGKVYVATQNGVAVFGLLQ